MRLFLFLILLSPLAQADVEWGDTYYCLSTTNSEIKQNEEITKFKEEPFKFRLDKNKNSMIFGNSGYFKDIVITITEENFSERRWGADIIAGEPPSNTMNMGKILFSEGKLVMTELTFSRADDSFVAINMFADCDKFE